MSLEYSTATSNGVGTATLKLAETAGDTDVDVLVVAGSVGGAPSQVLTLETGAGSVELTDFKRSTSNYTACLVVNGFTAYTINGEQGGGRDL